MIFLALIVLFILVFLARFNFFRIPKKGILVLLYHRIDNRPTFTSLDKFSISPETFEHQVEYLKNKGYKGVDPKNIDTIIENRLYLKTRYVLFTFDDGYKDNLIAADILKSYGYTGLFFIATDLIGKVYNGVDMLTENDLDGLVKMGMFLGSHSHEHKKLTEMPPDVAFNQVKTSISILSKFQNIEDFSYPFGNYNESLMKVLPELGIKRAYIIGQQIYQPELHKLLKIPRAIIRKDTNRIDFYLITTRGRAKF